MSITQEYEELRDFIGHEKYDAISLYIDEINTPEKYEAYEKDAHDFRIACDYSPAEWFNKREELKLKHAVVFMDQILYREEEWDKFDAWYSARFTANDPQAHDKETEAEDIDCV